jgi:hypothetical protein
MGKFSCPVYIGSSRLDASVDSQVCRNYNTVVDFMTEALADGVHGYDADPQGRSFVARDSVEQAFILVSSYRDNARIAGCSTKALVYFAKLEWCRESRRHNNETCPTLPRTG